MAIRNCALMLFLFTSVYSMGQSCQGDCQLGVISPTPYTAAQTAENTDGNFPQCVGSLCGTAWNGNQLEGIDAQQKIGSQYQFYDQNYYNIDANIAVGPTVSGENAQVLEWVNGDYVQAFDKVTGLPIFTFAGGTEGVPVTVDRLWSSSTQPECQDSTGNVQVIYDRLDNVFVISRRITYLESGIDHYTWCIALSSGSDLSNTTTIWHAYEFKMDTAIPCLPSSANCTTGTSYYYYPDWPRIGTWSNGFYITFDLQDPTAGYTEAGFEACQLDRADMVLGQSANPMTCYTYMVPQNEEPSLIHSVDVGDIDSPTVPPDEPEYFLSMVGPSNEQQGENGQGVCTSKSTPCTSNQLALFTWGTSGLVGPTFVTVNPYTPGCYDTSRTGSEINTVCVPVPSTILSQIGAYGSLLCGDYVPGFPCLDSLGDRMANRLTYNYLTGFGSGPNGYLTASHVVMESASNERTGIRYYILQVSKGAATVLVNSGGTSGAPDLQDPAGTLYYFMPSAALDKNGNLAIEYTTSGAYCSNCQTQYNPAISVDVLPWGTSTFEAPTLIVQGTGDQENTPHWGQYAATVIDSTDDLTFYGMGEYFNTSQTETSNCQLPASECHTWQTRIFRLALPAISLAPSSLAFGSQTINTTSAPQTVTLTNTGGAPLTLSSIEITGVNAIDFGETNTCGPTLAPGNSCQVSVTFTPTAVGSLSAAVSITDDAPRSPQTVSLVGTGTAAVATLSPLNLPFPVQYVKNSGSPQTVTLTNIGTATLAITNVVVSPIDFGIVSGQTTCGSSLAAGSNCSIGVFFDPTATGTRTGTLSVTDNAAGSPQTVTLTGTGQDFAVASSGSETATVAPGQTANYTIAVTPYGGFHQTVTLSCSGAPAQSACSLSPSSVPLNGSTPASVTVTVTTAGSTAGLAHPAGFPPASGTLAVWLAFCGLSGLALLGSDGRSRKRHGRLFYGLAFLWLISLVIMFSSCGGGSTGTASSTSSSNPPPASATPAGSYDLTVTGTFKTASTTLIHATKLTLVVQ